MSGDAAVSRGVLYPARLPTFHREQPSDEVTPFVRWFWIPEWDIAPGRVSRQHIVGFPTCNLVVEAGTAQLAGPATRASYRDLSGRGWAVGARLRPAAVPPLIANAAGLRDRVRSIDHPELVDAVGSAMARDAPALERRAAAVSAFTRWLSSHLGHADEEAMLANRVVDVAESDTTVLTLTDLATRVHASPRTVQRLTAKYVGLPPTALIRRRRLHEAAEHIRTDPGTDLASVALDLGYTHHAHLTRDFRQSLGFTPSSYRRALDPSPASLSGDAPSDNAPTAPRTIESGR